MSGAMEERFARLIKSLNLREISPVELHSLRLGVLPPGGQELRLEWNQAFADGDPVSPSPEMRVFRPKCEFFVKHGENVLFHHVSKFILAFSLVDAAAFHELWAEEDLRKAFMEKQIQHTLWPIFRQHAHDGMSRLGMQPIPLPWLM